MNINNLSQTIIGFLLAIVLTSCSEINTDNPQKIYKYWSGTNPASDLELLNGQYWQSAHWTKEYIMYLELKPSNEWWNEFLEQNHISVDKGDWVIPNDAPTWFKPSIYSIRYGGDSGFDQGSRYIKDTLTGVCYIYEIQL